MSSTFSIALARISDLLTGTAGIVQCESLSISQTTIPETLGTQAIQRAPELKEVNEKNERKFQ